jgi:hypothetical protein
MTVTIDFVAFDDERDACLLVLVEEGPWTGSVEDHLRALQDRLYGCLETALDYMLQGVARAGASSPDVAAPAGALPRRELPALALAPRGSGAALDPDAPYLGCAHRRCGPARNCQELLSPTAGVPRWRSRESSVRSQAQRLVLSAWLRGRRLSCTTWLIDLSSCAANSLTLVITLVKHELRVVGRR